MTRPSVAPRIVHRGLQITGVLDHKNETPYSVTRHHRDVLSASLTIANARIRSKSAAMRRIFQEP